MSRKGPTKNEYSQGFSYIAQKPKFLQNFGKPPSPPPANAKAGPSNPRGDGREPLPERPRDGKWAGGSDDEREKDRDESEDEWTEMYGGGDDGPQIVVLKEGRHLTSDEVKKERRRAAGKPSESPPPRSTSTDPPKTGSAEGKKDAAKVKPPLIPKPHINKRKLVGAAAGEDDTEQPGAKGDAPKKKKKAKPAKGLLSFDEVDE